jgi:hypothetical protein
MLDRGMARLGNPTLGVHPVHANVAAISYARVNVCTNGVFLFAVGKRAVHL